MQGETIKYDYLVFATGSRNAFIGEPPAEATTKGAMDAYFRGAGNMIKKSKSILILGGSAPATAPALCHRGLGNRQATAGIGRV